jgi:hypothetical protein
VASYHFLIIIKKVLVAHKVLLVLITVGAFLAVIF